MNNLTKANNAKKKKDIWLRKRWCLHLIQAKVFYYLIKPNLTKISLVSWGWDLINHFYSLSRRLFLLTIPNQTIHSKKLSNMKLTFTTWILPNQLTKVTLTIWFFFVEIPSTSLSLAFVECLDSHWTESYSEFL